MNYSLRHQLPGHDLTYILRSRYLEEMIFLGVKTSLNEALFRRYLLETTLGRLSSADGLVLLSSLNADPRFRAIVTGELPGIFVVFRISFRSPIFFNVLLGAGVTEIGFTSRGLTLRINLLRVHKMGLALGT